MVRETFPPVEKCATTGREKHTVVADLHGTLLQGRSSFPYFALTAYDIGGPLRLLLLVLASPLAGLLDYFVSESACIQVFIFATFAGVKVSSIESAARAVLPKFYSEDIRPDSWQVFSSCGIKCVITEIPRIMVEAFLKDILGADLVLGTEVGSFRGRATGFVRNPGVLMGNKKANAIVKAFGDEKPEIGLGDKHADFSFMTMCKEGYLVPPNPTQKPITQDQLPKPVIFHDGRLVQKPTPIKAFLILLWLPFGFILSLIRVAAAALVPVPYLYPVYRALGIKVDVKGCPPPLVGKSCGKSGVLFVCCHRTVLDSFFLSIALGRPIPALSYSASRLMELISPMKLVWLTRDRAKDASIIKKVLQEGDLFITPEGTTCREPFLLRFSALFTELTDHLVPVAIMNHVSMFHGTTVRGWKAMDIFYFGMNPNPSYEITFLRKVPLERTCSGGNSSHDVANYIQRIIASSLSYKCTNLTRKDKYKALAGNDGTVVEKSKVKSNK